MDQTDKPDGPCPACGAIRGSPAPKEANHYKLGLILIAVALVLDAIYGLIFAHYQHLPAWHGLYWALGAGETEGADVQPTRPLGYIMSTLVLVNVAPLIAGTFSLVTAGLTAIHFRGLEHRLKLHFEARLHHHLGTKP